jgi:hypothetical protein
MKSFKFIVCVLAVGLAAGSASAVTVNFSGTSASQSIPLAGQAIITASNVGVDGSFDVLTIEIFNTSPVQTAAGIANPLLTGFGFWVPDSSVDADDIESWSAELGTGSTDITGQYDINDGGLPGMSYFTVVASGDGNLGRIGNPAASGEYFDPGVPVIFDSVVFELTFGDGDLAGLTDGWWFQNDPNIALRFQSIGRGASDSGVAIPPGTTPTPGDTPPPPPPVPEPGTIALVGLGVLALAAARRKKRVE